MAARLRFASLGSGSRGNGTVVQAGRTCVLIDCGFSIRETERRLARLGLCGTDLDAILLTHEHGDHVAGAGALARRYGIAIWASAGTAQFCAATLGAVPHLEIFSSHSTFAIDGLGIEPLAVPHDAREPCQFVLGDGARRLGVLTDIGRETAFVLRRLAGVDALMLEFNHDEDLLAGGPYPQALKERIAGGLGHLSNRQAAALLARLDTSRLQHFVAAHLSETNNTPTLVRERAGAALGCTPTWIDVADQDRGLSWRELA